MDHYHHTDSRRPKVSDDIISSISHSEVSRRLNRLLPSTRHCSHCSLPLQHSTCHGLLLFRSSSYSPSYKPSTKHCSPSGMISLITLPNQPSTSIYNVNFVPTVDGANLPGMTLSISTFARHPEQCPGIRIFGSNFAKSSTVALILGSFGPTR